MQVPANQPPNRYAPLHHSQAAKFTRKIAGKDKEKSFAACGVRTYTKYKDRTAGCLWAITPTGLLFPPIELPESEHVRMTLLAMIK